MNTITIEKTGKTKRRYFSEYDEENTSCQVTICDDDFKKAYASSLTGDELKERMYMRIDAWKWNEK